ncbi:MAG: hypothetical protein ABH824_07260 [Nanoarchaeota archaeon]|nr:hypothetical protein [Nanoarchaeota archaeon]MBU1632352.1 hypothetical protein [Nanoarchaeota archaeon]MBU1876006.1 hypothetical protein [Nanoarchaeota archaeon]
MADEELKNLPPEERIKRLKELENKRKKEIEEAQNLIKESEEELTERRKWEDKVPLPEFASEDLQGLSEEAKEILRSQRGFKDKIKKEDSEEKSEENSEDGEKKRKTIKSRSNQDLEMLAREQIDLPQEIINSEYAMQLGQKPVNDLYQEVREIGQRVEKRGYMTREEERRVEYTLAGIEKKFEAEESGTYSFTEKTAMRANLTQQLGAQLLSKDLYKDKPNRNYQV